MKNLWNKVKESRVSYAVLALLCAIVLWLYVDITTEQDATTTIRNIPVTILNEETLTEKGLIITEGEDATVTLKLTGPRTILSQMNRSNISITANAGNISAAGTVQLTYDISFPSNLSISSFTIQSRSPSTIQLEISAMKTNTLQVTPVFTGSVAEDYLYDLSDFVLSVPEITISGEESLVDGVAKAQVILAETDLSATWTGTLPIQLLDAEGNEIIDTDGLTISATETEVTFPVRAVKTVALTVSFLPGGGATEQDITYTLSKTELMISGEETELEQIDSISLGTIDLSQVITAEELEFPITLPEGIVNESSVNEVTVNVVITGLQTRKVTTTDIRLTNVPEGLSATLVTTSLDVRIRGQADTMQLLTDEDVYVEVDLAAVETTATGSVSLPATVKVAGMSDIGAIDTYSVVVELTKGETTATASED